MAVALRPTDGRLVGRSKRAAAGHPAWWIYALAAAAWFVLAILRPHPSPHVHHHGGALPEPSVGVAWTWWTLMAMAMMLPLVAPAATLVAKRSLWRRRHHAMAVFLVGYAAVWALFGLSAVIVVQVAGPVGAPRVAVAAGLAGAAWWQVSSTRRRSLRRCGSIPTPAPRGWRADRDCLGVGTQVGRACLVTCWPIMATMALGHGMLLMAGLALVLLSERRRGPNPARRAGRPAEAWALATLAGLVLVFGVH